MSGRADFYVWKRMYLMEHRRWVPVREGRLLTTLVNVKHELALQELTRQAALRAPREAATAPGDGAWHTYAPAASSYSTPKGGQ